MFITVNGNCKMRDHTQISEAAPENGIKQLSITVMVTSLEISLSETT